MPNLTKDKKLLRGFTSRPYSGLTKTQDNEYSHLQNVRGFGGFGAKRPGIQGMTTLSSGIMGIFDLKVDGDADSPDRFMVYLNDGSVMIYEPSELTILFEYLFDSGVYLNLQSPNGDWWEVYPDSTTGILQCNGISAPGTTISSDLFVPINALFGFIASSTKIYRLYVDLENISQPRIAVRQYGASSAINAYSTVQAFTTGAGPVFQDNLLRNYRLRVANGGFLEIIQTA